VAGRGLAFADPEIVDLLKTRFVAAAGDDWYRRRRQDAEGEFFRRVADQSPRKGEGGSTRQGLYCFTASGELLAYRNSFDPAAVKALLKQALDKWQSLPESARQPRPFKVDPGKPDPRFDRRPPEGALILRVHARELEGRWKPAPDRGGRPNLASLDHLWLKKEEWQSLVPTKLDKGFTYPMTAALLRRIARFHFVDNTRGEPPMWQSGEIKSAEAELRIEGVKKGVVTIRISGRFSIESDDMGFEGVLGGSMDYSPEKRSFTRFDWVAVGDHWGQGTYTHGARPGKAPLGVAIVLGDPADPIPPQAARDVDGYFRTD
jgi:hypothetical protein